MAVEIKQGEKISAERANKLHKGSVVLGLPGSGDSGAVAIKRENGAAWTFASSGHLGTAGISRLSGSGDEAYEVLRFTGTDEIERPDLTTREGLAGALFALRHPGNEEGYTASLFRQMWEGMADLVRENFTHNDEVPFRIGDEVKIVGGDYDGRTGTIEYGLDSDNEYKVEWDSDYYDSDYVNEEFVKRA